VVLINGHGLGTDTVPAETPIGVITHDSIAARCARLHRGGYLTSPATFTDGDERALLVRARLVSAIQLDDVERFRSQCSHAEVTWLPPSFRVEDASWKRPPVGMSCLFVGSASLPNVDGLNWFLDSVWPIVMARRPDAVLRVVGSVCDRVRHRPGVELLGRVRDLDLEYSRTRMCVVPLRVGSGLKIKTAEAIAHHRPLVTTSIGAEGLPRGTRESMLVCDDAVTFAEAVLLLLAEEAVRQRLIAATGRSAPLFDTNRFAEPFIASLHRLNHTRA
jgi:succinoglycan biosynthesis protein ExoO